MGQFIPESTSKAYSSNDAIQNLTNRLVARGSPLKVFDNVIRNQPAILLDSKIPSRFKEDSTRFIYNVLRNFTNNLNYNS